MDASLQTEKSLVIPNIPNSSKVLTDGLIASNNRANIGWVIMNIHHGLQV